jgi:hypothetical protein
MAFFFFLWHLPSYLPMQSTFLLWQASPIVAERLLSLKRTFIPFLTPPCDEELSLRHPHGIIRREPRMHIRILGSPYLLASLSIAVANYSQKQIWGFHTNSNQIIWGFQHFSLILPCILLLTSFCIIAPQPAAMLAEVFLIAFF